MTHPPANVLDLPLEVRAEMAMQAAWEKLVVEHAKQGWPLVVSRDGKIVEVSPEELKIEAAQILAEIAFEACSPAQHLTANQDCRKRAGK